MDRNALILARRYAQAFIDDFHKQLNLAECEKLQDFAAELARAHSALALVGYMEGSLQEKTDLLYEQFKKHGLILDAYKKLIHLLFLQKRITLLANVLRAIVMLFKESDAITSFTISSSHALTHEQEQSIIQFLQRLTHTTVEHITKIDSQLIAGIRLQSSSLLWEDSVQDQLRSLVLKSNR